MTDEEYIKFKPTNPVWTEYGIDWDYHSRIPGMVEFHFEGDKVRQVQSMDKTEVLRIEKNSNGKLIVTISMELKEAAEEFWKILEDVAAKYGGMVKYSDLR